MDCLKANLHNETGSATGAVRRLFSNVLAAVCDGFNPYDFPSNKALDDPQTDEFLVLRIS